MAGFDRGDTLAERFRTHAGTNSHLYGYAMRGMADDWEAGGPLRQICAGYEDAPTGAALQLRLLAGVFRIVLTGRAPELLRFYPCLGGEDPPSDAWSVMRAVIAEHGAELHDALQIAPQTNEVGRAAALLAGLFDVVAASGCAQIRLLELGASAGLNLLLDRYGFAGSGWRWGSMTSPVQLTDAIRGPVQPQTFRIASRRGCDLHPIDLSSETGRVLLTSFVWPFDLHRHDRLAAALRLAVRDPAPVDRGLASDWLAQQLSEPQDSDILTVVWHSITQLYWPQSEIDRVGQTLAAAGSSNLLARVAMEFNPSSLCEAGPEVRTELWSAGATGTSRRRCLGTAHDHGVPVTLATG